MDFMRVMEAEHCHGSGVQRYFTTVNYRITTCPRLEWQYVVRRIKCPEGQMHSGRRIESIEKLMKDELAIEAKLQQAEIVAVVLYSGPMVRGALYLGCRCTVRLAAYAPDIWKP